MGLRELLEDEWRFAAADLCASAVETSSSELLSLELDAFFSNMEKLSFCLATGGPDWDGAERAADNLEETDARADLVSSSSSSSELESILDSPYARVAVLWVAVGLRSFLPLFDGIGNGRLVGYFHAD